MGSLILPVCDKPKSSERCERCREGSGSKQRAGTGKCCVAVIPWPPGPKVNTKYGRKIPDWLDVSSSSEERVIQEDQKASHLQCEAKQSWPQLLPHLQVMAWDRHPLKSTGERRGASFINAKLWMKRENEKLPKAETAVSNSVTDGEGKLPFYKRTPRQSGDLGSWRAQAAEGVKSSLQPGKG